MAEGVVGLLIVKLSFALATEAASLGKSLVCKEVSALKALFGEMRDMKEELEGMQAFLQGAERFKDVDGTTGIFIKKIRELAFETEDIVDEFTYKLEDKSGSGWTRRLKHVKTWRRLAQELKAVKVRLERAEQMKVRYDMRGLKKEDERIGDNSRYPNHNQASYFASETELVGIEENKELLMRWLTVKDPLEQRRIIATVWGMGGVGKTTLVAHVYNIVKVNFETSAWITVSKSYQVDDLLRKIACELGITVEMANTERRSLVEVIRNYLRGKNHILVLDDVWAADVWFKIRETFPLDCVCRYIITSRIHEVALLATRNRTIELKPLSSKYSCMLLRKEAFWRNEDKQYPPELHHLAHKFLDKCNGLPIAIAGIGRLLSFREPIYSVWEGVYKDLELQLNNSTDVTAVLKVSLEDLPRELKNCFLHCAIFPEDHLIKRRRVIRHWIAAGFVTETEHKTLEDAAEDYLNEFVNRSLLQVVERNTFGRVRSCRMHDIIYLLAINKTRLSCPCGYFNPDAGRHYPS